MIYEVPYKKHQMKKSKMFKSGIIGGYSACPQRTIHREKVLEVLIFSFVYLLYLPKNVNLRCF